MIIKHGRNSCSRTFSDCAFWVLIGWADKPQAHGKKLARCSQQISQMFSTTKKDPFHTK